MRTGQRLRALLMGADRRVLRAEAYFFDSYGRGGCREPHELVIPIGFFARERVKAMLREWLSGKKALDVDGLCVEWHAAVPSDAEREERLFFKNLAHFVAVVNATPSAHEPAWRASLRMARAPPEPWAYGRRRG